MHNALNVKGEKRFHKVLSKFYIKWFRDSCDSAVWCRERGDEKRASMYLNDAHEYLNIIMENWDAIEFFSLGHNAYQIDAALPEQFRGYR